MTGWKYVYIYIYIIARFFLFARTLLYLQREFADSYVSQTRRAETSDNFPRAPFMLLMLSISKHWYLWDPDDRPNKTCLTRFEQAIHKTPWHISQWLRLHEKQEAHVLRITTNTAGIHQNLKVNINIYKKRPLG